MNEWKCVWEMRRDRVFGAKIDDQQHNKLQFHTCDWHKNDSRKWTLSRTSKDPKQYTLYIHIYWYMYIVILETIFTVLYQNFWLVLELLILCYWCCRYFLCCCFTAPHSQIFTQWRCRAKTKVEREKNTHTNTYIHIFAWDEKQEKCTKQIL